ncbi:MAG: SDR family oxidoreductase [Bacteroidales bacterium]|nr:SDR family oxidoreductase [Bacteroidales bacterium]MCF8328191.1 SDR family oxidoreductase [Bacteroidales bacterium]
MNIIITGASRGIGYELVKWFAREGKHNILALSRSKSKLQELQREATNEGKSRVFILPFDLVNGNFRDELLPFVNAHLPKVDVLINNAGKLINKRIEDTSDDEFDAQFNVNIKGPFKIVRALYEHFAENAHIVNITSMGGYQGSIKFPGLGIYSASKGAISIFTEALAEEWKERNVFVNALALGAVQTEMLSEAFPQMNVDTAPDEMAAYIGQFALTGHRFYNGKVLPVTNSTP